MEKPLISVVTVCFNAVRDIEKTILSVINQTYQNIEYIIIDGGSTDGTVDIIKKYAGHITYWVSEPDKGIYDAMNKGIKVATGEWINFMNAGDVFYDDSVVEKFFNTTLNHNVKVIYGDCVMKGLEHKSLCKAKPLSVFYKQQPFYHQSVFIKTEYCQYDINLRIASDYKLSRNIYEKYGKSAFFYKSFPVSIYDMTGISSCNKRLCREEYNKLYYEYNVLYGFWDSLKLKIKKIIGMI